MSSSDIRIDETAEAPPRPERPRLSDADVRPAREPVTEPAVDAPVAEAPRERDYLDGFLSKKPEPLSGTEPGGALYEAVIDALKDIYDPEIPVNIYDLGLVYGLEFAEAHAIVTMTLTTPHCPVAESMPAEVEMRVSAVPGVASAEVNLIWDPPWDPQKMSDEAKLELGML
jgi:FeS assembly SUF system protein